MDLCKYFIETMLYPIMEKKQGNRVRTYLKEMKDSQSVSYEELREIQQEKLKKLLLDCIDNVPAYKDYSYLRPMIEKDAIGALKKFPILDKKVFRESSELYLNGTIPKSNLIKNQTGGSTGEPTKFYMDRVTVEHYEAARWRGLSWWGITPGSRSVMIWGNPIELNRMQQKKYVLKEKWLKNRIVIPAYSLESKSIKNYIDRIEKYKPEYFYGYASVLDVFATLMIRENISLSFKPKAVVSTAETLHDFQRKNIQKAFDCEVVNEYGARDAGILAFECKSGHMHIVSENALIEVVDLGTMEPITDGKSGSIVVTDLNNHSMPRLRYKLGDNIEVSNLSCDCGISLPLLGEISGREDDIFITPEGKLVHGHVFSHIARSFNSIEKFQIIQKSPNYVELSIIRKKTYIEKEVDRFITEIKEMLPKVEMKVNYVSELALTGSGKFRYAIRDFEI